MDYASNLQRFHGLLYYLADICFHYAEVFTVSAGKGHQVWIVMFSIADLALMTLWRVVEFKCRAGFLTANQFISVFYSSFMMQPFRNTRPRCQSETMSRNVIKMLRRTIQREALLSLIVQAAWILVVANIHLPSRTHRTWPGVLFRTQERDRYLHFPRIKQLRVTAKLESCNKKLDWFTHLCPSLICAVLIWLILLSVVAYLGALQKVWYRHHSRWGWCCWKFESLHFLLPSSVPSLNLMPPQWP